MKQKVDDERGVGPPDPSPSIPLARPGHKAFEQSSQNIGFESFGPLPFSGEDRTSGESGEFLGSETGVRHGRYTEEGKDGREEAHGPWLTWVWFPIELAGSLLVWFRYAFAGSKRPYFQALWPFVFFVV
jgi:hypothetical protein